jgi:hypothetical protein
MLENDNELPGLVTVVCTFRVGFASGSPEKFILFSKNKN